MGEGEAVARRVDEPAGQVLALREGEGVDEDVEAVVGLAPAGEDPLDVLVALDVAGLDERRADRLRQGPDALLDQRLDRTRTRPRRPRRGAPGRSPRRSSGRSRRRRSAPSCPRAVPCPPSAAAGRGRHRRALRARIGRAGGRRPPAGGLLRLGHPDVVEAGLDDPVRAGVGRREPEPDRLAGVGAQVDRQRSPAGAPLDRRARGRRGPCVARCRRRRRRPRPGARPRTSRRASWAKVQRNWSFWPAASGRSIARRRDARPSAVEVVGRARRSRPRAR